jgi:tRNA(fMet)-specific endonuclease VapC
MSETVYCLDSDVVIWHLRKGDRQRAVDELLEKLAAAGTLGCSMLTVAEVEQGVRKGEEEKTRGFLRSLKPYFVDRDVAERAGEVVRGLRATGITVGLADAIIAATCIVHGLTLVTLNVSDFEKVEGLSLQTVP